MVYPILPFYVRSMNTTAGSYGNMFRSGLEMLTTVYFLLAKKEMSVSNTNAEFL